MEEIKAPKKERKFLRAMGDIALTLARELVIGIGKKLINKVGNKRQGLVIAAILFSSITAIAQYPGTGNKMRLGYQTTGDGLVYRGRAADTLSLKSSGLNNAYFILDTLNNIVYNYIKTKGGWQFTNRDTIIINNNFTQPVDSLFFKTSVTTNNVDTAKMRWDAELGTVVLGMYDKVPNELGFKTFWLVKNQTGSTITKGSIVYASGTVGNGNNARITVAKFIANGTIDAKYLLGITAHDLSNAEDGYVISFGKVRQVNTDTFSPGAILYPSPTVAGVWTDIEPVAPNIDMPIGFCINSHANNGAIAIRVATGYKLHELHDVAITSPVDRASLYYRSGIWRDTTVALLTSDTASMLTNYLRTGVAANTFLPLSGGTLTGALNGTMGTFNTRLGVGSFAASPLLFASGTGNQEVHFAHSQNVAGATVTLRLTNTNATNYTQGAYFQGIVNRGISEMSGALGANGSEYIRLRGVDDGGVVGVGIFNTNPSYNLDVTGTFRATGASLIGGTFGVTGATTFTNLGGSPTSIVTASSTGLLSGITTLPIANGGTGATTNTQARVNLQVPNISTTITPQAPLTGGGSLAGDRTISIPVATNIANGYLSSTDWTTFNSKGNGTVTNVSAAVTPNGLSVATGTTTPVISMALAASGTTGVVSNGTQTFSGSKTFLGDINGSSALNVTGFSTFLNGLGITNLASTSSLTRVIGVNSSNAIGELTLSGGLSVSAGNLSIQAATASQTGTVISFGSQTFGGNKIFNGNVNISTGTLDVGSTGTFGGRVKTNWLERNYAYSTSSSFTVSVNTTWQDINTSVLTTLTLPNPATYPGKEIHIRQSGAGQIISFSSNIIPFTIPPTGSPVTAILNPASNRAVTLVSDGNNWVIMQRSEN